MSAHCHAFAHSHQKQEKLKRGRGSQKKSKVLVTTESQHVADPAKGKHRRADYLKMNAIEGLKKKTISTAVQQFVSSRAEITSGDSTSCVDLKDFAFDHHPSVIPKNKAGEQLPRVHIAVSNTQRVLLSSYHKIRPEFLQNYLDKFCVKTIFRRSLLRKGSDHAVFFLKKTNTFLQR